MYKHNPFTALQNQLTQTLIDKNKEILNLLKAMIESKEYETEEM